MPEISRFYGIIIYMFGDEHFPPHFHVNYNEFDAMIDIENGDLLKGEIPKKQLKLIQAWAEIHKDELMNNFKNLQGEVQFFNKIEPLR